MKLRLGSKDQGSTAGAAKPRLWKTLPPLPPDPQLPPAAGLTGHGRLPQTAPSHTPWKTADGFPQPGGYYGDDI